MPHGRALQHQAFILTHCRHPLRPSGCLHIQSWSAGLKVCQPSVRRVSPFSDDTTTRRLQHSNFIATLAKGDALQLESPSKTRNRENLVENRILVQASIRDLREGASSDQTKLFLIDARWIIDKACNKVSVDSPPADEPRLLRRFISILSKFLNTYAKTCPVAVVLPNENELTQLISKACHTRKDVTIYFQAALKKICRAIGVAVYADNSNESRDIIGSLLKQTSNIGIPVVIVSSDSDFLQLLEREHVTIMKPGSNTKLEHISEQFFTDTMHGLHPRQYIDLLALIRNQGIFERIPGISDVRALLLISHFGTIENLIAGARTVVKPWKTPKKREASGFQKSQMPVFLPFRTARRLLRDEKELLQAKRLISINQKHYDGVRLNDLKRQPVRRSHLIRILHRFEDLYRKQTSRQHLQASYKVQEKQRFDLQTEPLTLQVISAGNERHLQPAALKDRSAVSTAELRKPGSTVTDTRRSNEDVSDILSTTGSSLGLLPVFRTDQKDQILTGIAIGGQQAATYVDLSSPWGMPKSLKDVLQSNAVEKHGVFLRHLYKYLLTEHDITMNGTLFDARIALDLLNAKEQDIYDLASGTAGSQERITFDLLSNRTSSAPEYSEERSVSVCCALTQFISGLRDKLDREGLLSLALRVEFPLIRVLGSMELKGVPIDRKELTRLKIRCSERVSEIEDEISGLLQDYAPTSVGGKAAAGKVFDTGYPLNSATKSEYINVAKSTASCRALERISSDVSLPNHDRILANLLIQHEQLSRFMNRSIAPLSQQVQDDHRVHSTFVQGSCATGRLATKNPNLQNIPVRSQLGRELRDTFRTNNGMLLLRADYSQIELRIVASLCSDPFMLDAFSSGADIHKYIAGKIFDTPTTDVTAVQRKQAKQVVYSILYGVSSSGLSERLGIPVREAENLLSEFKIEFPAVQELANRLVDEASKMGYAKTLFGRRLPLPTLTGGDASERRAASRRAINMPIQGTQADMIKLAMVRIHERLRANDAISALVLQVHDELILEVADNELQEVVSLVEEEMISALPLTGVDVVVQIRYGPSWSTSFQPFSKG